MAFVAQQIETFECMCCDDTHTGKANELHGLGWVRHSQRGTFFLMCKACEQWFEPKWKAQRERKAA